MALNCRLDRNITLSQPDSGGTDSCNGQDISMGVGGISSPVLVYNISDVPSLTFEGDNRSDYSLYVETINSIGKFYKVDHTDATYNEEYDNHKWTHSLSLTVANITPLFEDILSDAVNGKYIVCFKPNGAEDYRMFGWKFGATLDYSLNITSDSLGYTITFEDTSEYPLFTVAKDNFGTKDKVYTPIFVPLYDVYYCEQDQEGHHTGFIIAMYVVKVNAAGQPLGSDNKLCQWTGKKQDAYKINTIQSDGGYNIIGTYAPDAVFDGKPVKLLDYEKCPANVTNSIFINSKKAETINLNSTISGGSFTITSTDDWMMVTDPQYVTITPVEGVNGNTQCSLHHNGIGGCEQIKFMNKVTSEIVTLDVCVNLVKIGELYTYPHETTDIVLTPTVEGCDTAFTYTITPSVTNSVDEYGNIHITFPDTDDDLEYTLTTIHGCDPNERKITRIFREGIDTDPSWIKTSSWCEVDESTGIYTGYRIDRYIDYNSKSSTYMQSKEEKTLDESCSVGFPTWVVIESYCELSSSGTNTGYYILVQQDINEASPTYGQTQTTRTYNQSVCPPVSDEPKWILDPTFDPYCEQIVYEPSMVEGNSGILIVRLFDNNLYSPTYNEYQESGMTKEDWTEDFIREYGEFPCDTPDTEPNVEEILKVCETEEVSGTIKYTGYAIITGMDKNPYSPTYLETVTVKELDEECGGSPTCQCSDLVTKDEPTPTCQCSDLVTKDEPTPTCQCSDLVTKDEPTPPTCSCNDLVTNGNTIYYDKDGETNEIATYQSCISNISVSDPSSWGNTYTSSNGSLRLTVPSNQTSSARNETVTISYSNGTDSCSKTIVISQEADTPTPPSPESYWDTGLPVLVINTAGGQPIISKDVWLEDTSVQIYLDRTTIVYNSNADSIRGRGNSSWEYSDKKPYALKLANKSEILGMASSKRWVLLANYGDRTLMRNVIANEIAQCTDLSTGMEWSPIGKFVELVLNGEHRGNYYLSEQVRVETNRLNIDEDSDYLLEIDRNYDETYKFRSTIKDYPYNIKSPDAPDVSYIEDKIDTIEILLNNGSGYESYIDYNSFADYWIVYELTQNFEAMGHSPGSVYCYFLPDSSFGKLKMGPPWDFDYSTFNLYWPLKANQTFCDGTTVPSNGYMPETLIMTCHIYYDYLFQDSNFKTVVKFRWNSIKSRLDAIINRFDYWYNVLYASEQLNWAMWEIPDDFEVGHHPDYNLTFLQAKDRAKEFYIDRLSYLDNLINSF